MCSSSHVPPFSLPWYLARMSLLLHPMVPDIQGVSGMVSIWFQQPVGAICRFQTHCLAMCILTTWWILVSHEKTQCLVCMRCHLDCRVVVVVLCIDIVECNFACRLYQYSTHLFPVSLQWSATNITILAWRVWCFQTWIRICFWSCCLDLLLGTCPGFQYPCLAKDSFRCAWLFVS